MRTWLNTTFKDPLPWSLPCFSFNQWVDAYVELPSYPFFFASTAFQEILDFVVILCHWKLADCYNPPNNLKRVFSFYFYGADLVYSLQIFLSILSEILKKYLLSWYFESTTKNWCQNEKYYHTIFNNYIGNDSIL